MMERALKSIFVDWRPLKHFLITDTIFIVSETGLVVKTSTSFPWRICHEYEAFRSTDAFEQHEHCRNISKLVQIHATMEHNANKISHAQITVAAALSIWIFHRDWLFRRFLSHFSTVHIHFSCSKIQKFHTQTEKKC